MILLRLHQSISIILSLRIRHVLYILNYTFIAGIAGAVDTGFFYLFFEHWAITLLQEKHKTWEREDNPVNDTSVMKNIPSSLSVIAPIVCLDVWRRNPRPIALFRSRRDGRIALRLPSHSEQTRKEEKEIDHLPHSRFLSDSSQECSVLSNSFNNVFRIFWQVFHFVPYSFY